MHRSGAETAKNGSADADAFADESDYANDDEGMCEQVDLDGYEDDQFDEDDGEVFTSSQRREKVSNLLQDLATGRSNGGTGVLSSLHRGSPQASSVQ